MHEEHEIEMKLKVEAARLSAELGNAPVAIVVGGSESAKIPRVMTASSFPDGGTRLRDLLGLLETSIQIESWKHFRTWK